LVYYQARNILFLIKLRSRVHETARDQQFQHSRSKVTKTQYLWSTIAHNVFLPSHINFCSVVSQFYVDRQTDRQTHSNGETKNNIFCTAQLAIK